ncbi:MAG: DUF1579 domain-containing protein [bacterium]|nr:DUF1579 domain-containing protein [bacterium]
MKPRTLFLATILFTGGALLGGATTRQDGETPGKPGEIHERMAVYAGEYDVKTTFGMAPGAEANESTGTAVLKTALGGRFLVEENKGTMMGTGYEGMRWWGYNTGSSELESVWTWTLSTGMLSMRGALIDDEGTADWKATYHDERGEEHEVHVITRAPDEDHFVIEMYSDKTEDGEEFLMMKEEFTRKP